MSGFDTSSVNDMGWMFYWSGFETLNISSFDMSGAPPMSFFLDQCMNLRTLIVGDGFYANDFNALPEKSLWKSAQSGEIFLSRYIETNRSRIADTYTRCDSSAITCDTVLPPQTSSIAAEAFMNDTSIKNVLIPASCTSIGSRAFAGCTNLRFVVFEVDSVSIADDAFDSAVSTCFVAPVDSDAIRYAVNNDIPWYAIDQ